MQMTYAAFFAPQVPVVPMAYGPVPTVSAYYVPTVPVTQTVFTPVAAVHKWKHHHKKARVWIRPVTMYPVYWMQY